MPAPTRTRIEIGSLVERVASLEHRLRVKTLSGPVVTIDADPDQLEQVLINLIRNAADASLDPSLRQAGSVEVGWRTNARSVEVFIRDEGPGLLNSENLFVPFFTTKHGGSGIGLILSRQIAEAHGGVVLLANRQDRCGCEAVIALPVSYSSPADAI
jgi:signal transduction histidine kinase